MTLKNHLQKFEKRLLSFLWIPAKTLQAQGLTAVELATQRQEQGNFKRLFITAQLASLSLVPPKDLTYKISYSYKLMSMTYI